MVLSLPKTPRIADLVPVLEVFDARLTELEAYVSRNDARITALEDARVAPLEEFAAEHRAGAHRRQEELDAVRGAMQRERFLRTLRR